MKENDNQNEDQGQGQEHYWTKWAYAAECQSLSRNLSAMSSGLNKKDVFDAISKKIDIVNHHLSDAEENLLSRSGSNLYIPVSMESLEEIRKELSDCKKLLGSDS